MQWCQVWQAHCETVTQRGFKMLPEVHETETDVCMMHESRYVINDSLGCVNRKKWMVSKLERNSLLVHDISSVYLYALA
jgi:hypothetical protein